MPCLGARATFILLSTLGARCLDNLDTHKTRMGWALACGKTPGALTPTMLHSAWGEGTSCGCWPSHNVFRKMSHELCHFRPCCAVRVPRERGAFAGREPPGLQLPRRRRDQSDVLLQPHH